MNTFRRASAGDMDQILRVIEEARAFIRDQGIDQWQDGYPEPEILLRDIELEQLYVLAEGDAVHAVAALTTLPEPVYDVLEGGRWRNEGRYLTIHRMALDDSCRGSGAAGTLLEAAYSIAEGADCASVRADTHRGNKAMRRFLEKNGFEERGIVYYVTKQGDPVRVAYEKLM